MTLRLVQGRGWIAALLAVVVLLPAAAGLVLPLQSYTAREALELTIQGGGLVDSLAFAALAGAASVAVAWITAAASARLPRPLQWMVLLLVCLPLLMPASLVATGWILALGRSGGLHEWSQRTLGLALPRPFDWHVAACLTGWRYLGPALLILLADRRRREGLWQAARIYRVPWGRRLYWIHVRPAVGAAAIAWIVVAALTMNDGIMPAMLQVNTYTTQVLIRYSAMLDPAGAAAMALGPAALGLAAALTLLRALQRREEMVSTSPVSREPASAVGVTLSAALTLVVLACLLMPLLAVLWRASGWSGIIDALRDAGPELRVSIIEGILAAAVCAGVAAVLADAWRSGPRLRWQALLPAVIASAGLPAATIGLGMIAICIRLPVGLRSSYAPLIAAQVVRFVPLAVLVLIIMWRGESDAPVAAAKVHGVRQWRQAVYIRWLPRAPGLAMTMAVVVMLIIAELELAVLLVPPGVTTIGVRLYTMIHDASDQRVADLAAGVLLVPVLPMLALLVAATTWYAMGRRRHA